MKGTTPPIFGVLNTMAMTVCRHLALLTPADCPGPQKMQFLRGGYTVSRIFRRLRERNGNLLSGTPPPNSGVPDTMVTLPSGGLTVLSVSSALQGRISQGSGRFFFSEKTNFQNFFSYFFAYPPPIFGMPDTLAIFISCSLTSLPSYL